MLLTVERFAFGRDSTLGELLVDGVHECYTLEDERRVRKVPGETCIPEGIYPVMLRDEGGMHQRYDVRFTTLHRGMIWLRNVSNFQWVYIHIGNDDKDTDGCILVGRHPVVLPDGEFKVASSTEAYVALYRKILAAMDSGEIVLVRVKERQPLGQRESAA